MSEIRWENTLLQGKNKSSKEVQHSHGWAPSYQIATLWPSGLTGSRDSLGQALDSWHSVSYVSYLLICGRKFITLVSAILLGKLVIFILTSILFSFRRISDILNWKGRGRYTWPTSLTSACYSLGRFRCENSFRGCKNLHKLTVLSKGEFVWLKVCKEIFYVVSKEVSCFKLRELVFLR